MHSKSEVGEKCVRASCKWPSYDTQGKAKVENEGVSEGCFGVLLGF